MYPLLRQRRNVRNEPRQPVSDNAVGREIGFRHRRPVELAFDRHDLAVDGEDRNSRLHHEIGQRLHQRGSSVAIDHARLIRRLVSCF